MKLVDNIQDRFTARLVYADMVEQGGLIVIPAIRVAGGGGGGGGTDPENGEGEGAGFGLRATGEACRSMGLQERLRAMEACH
jgi:uncharacterized spore protein YtfJ